MNCPICKQNIPLTLSEIDKSFICPNHFFIYFDLKDNLIMFAHEKELIRLTWSDPNNTSYNVGFNTQFNNWSIQLPYYIKNSKNHSEISDFIANYHKDLTKYNAFL